MLIVVVNLLFNVKVKSSISTEYFYDIYDIYDI